jgi:hypothetical protein
MQIPLKKKAFSNAKASVNASRTNIKNRFMAEMPYSISALNNYMQYFLCLTQYKLFQKNLSDLFLLNTVQHLV